LYEIMDSPRGNHYIPFYKRHDHTDLVDGVC
jgi:hypothetical protein